MKQLFTEKLEAAKQQLEFREEDYAAFTKEMEAMRAEIKYLEDAIAAMEVAENAQSMVDEATESLIFAASLAISTDVNKNKEVAYSLSPAIDRLPVRDWEPGMTTAPGDIVYDPDKNNRFLFTHTASMEHNNPTFYPGSIGVYYWSFIPTLYNNIKVWPTELTTVTIVVKQNELWYNSDKSRLFMFTGVDNSDWIVDYFPGMEGVHDWKEVVPEPEEPETEDQDGTLEQDQGGGNDISGTDSSEMRMD